VCVRVRVRVRVCVCLEWLKSNVLAKCIIGVVCWDGVGKGTVLATDFHCLAPLAPNLASMDRTGVLLGCTLEHTGQGGAAGIG